jgi:hypothetical protein
LEGVFLTAAFSFKVEMGGRQVDFLGSDVHEVELDEDAVLALSPFSGGVALLGEEYSI